MRRKSIVLRNKGMLRDLSISKRDSEYAYENFNIRLTPNNGDTLMSVTNEKGTKKIAITDEDTDEALDIANTVIGYSVLNSWLILFTTANTNPESSSGNDSIYRLRHNNGTWTGKRLYYGNLNFCTKNPIETISYYESENIQKVYWVDGRNQPRFINFMRPEGFGSVSNTFFDFITTYSTVPTVSIEKLYQGSGNFPAGTVQYVITYSNEYGQETNIVYQSSLYYLSPTSRGAAADSTVNCQMEITISNIDSSFKYVNIYSIIRTSLDGTPQAKRIARLTTKSSVVFIDNNGSGESIDATTLLYIGGREISAGTMTHKDNILFLGDIRIKGVAGENSNEIRNQADAMYNDSYITSNVSFELSSGNNSIPHGGTSGIYPYINQLNYPSNRIKSFKGGEKYRFAVRFFTNTGESSQAYFIGDAINSNCYPEMSATVINRPIARIRIPAGLASAAWSAGYRYIQPLIAEPSYTDRAIVAQGFVQPTLFNMQQRNGGNLYSISSWFTRFIGSNDYSGHFSSLSSNTSSWAEVQCMGEGGVFPFMTESQYKDSNTVQAYYCIVCRRLAAGASLTLKVFSKDSAGNVQEISSEKCENATNAIRGTGDDQGSGRLAQNFYTTLSKSSYFAGLISKFKSKDGIEEWWLQTRKTSWPKQSEFIVYPHDRSDTFSVKVDSLKADTWASNIDFPTEGESEDVIQLNAGAGATGVERFVTHYKNYYYHDESVLTFHTPEFTDDNSSLFDQTTYNFRIIGVAALTGNITQYDIDISADEYNTGYVQALDFSSINTTSGTEYGLYTHPLYSSEYYSFSTNADTQPPAFIGTYLIYPWHKQGSVTCKRETEVINEETQETAETGKIFSELNSHTTANLWYTNMTSYLWKGGNAWVPRAGISSLRAYNYDDNTFVALQVPTGNSTYTGNYDFMLSMQKDTAVYQEDSEPYDSQDSGYYINLVGGTSVSNTDSRNFDAISIRVNPDKSDESGEFSAEKFYDPIRIQYKSGKHIVFSLNPTGGTSIVTLPHINNDGRNNNRGTMVLPWTDYQDSEAANATPATLFLPSQRNLIQFTMNGMTITELRSYIDNDYPEFCSKYPNNKAILNQDMNLYTIGTNAFSIVSKQYPTAGNFSISYDIDDYFDEDDYTAFSAYTSGTVTIRFNVPSWEDRPSGSSTYPAAQVYISGSKTETLNASAGNSAQKEVSFSTGNLTSNASYSITVRVTAPDSTYTNSQTVSIGTLSVVPASIYDRYNGIPDISGKDFLALTEGSGTAKYRLTGTVTVPTIEGGVGTIHTSDGSDIKISGDFTGLSTGSSYSVIGTMILMTMAGEEESTPGLSSIYNASEPRPVKTNSNISSSTEERVTGTTTAERNFTVSGTDVSGAWLLTNPRTSESKLWSSNSWRDITPNTWTIAAVGNLSTGAWEYNSYPKLFIGELYNESTYNSAYGGASEYAIQNNTFIPAGNISVLSQGGMEILATEGDTYFQRWDCVRTLPVENAYNNIVDICSVMLETHTNIDGRYDNRRGSTDIVNTTSENFNLFNSVYNQNNNMFTSSVLSEQYDLDYYPSQITWTKTKTPTEEVDTWTNITLASVLDMDGDKGPVRALRRFQNSIISFQDKGIAEILFNTRTQMATAQGVPVELANSGKVDGKRYITDKAGCINKWSIIETKNGIYFIDNINSSINLFTGSVMSLSDAKGFKNWIGENNNTSIWNPSDYSNFLACWDRINDDIYFLSGSNSGNLNTLCYNEMIQQFTSFYNYGNVLMMTNVDDTFVSFRDGSLWEHGTGTYNVIYDTYQPYYVEYKVTPDPYGDKLFTNLEYRADVFDMADNSLEPDSTFTSITVSNEYQRAEVIPPVMPVADSVDARRKFRIWRMDIPRDASSDNKYGLNRIRNPWINLRLSKSETTGNHKMEIHDIGVVYYE